MNKEKPLVSICCLAFNHASYIEQCLDGFLAQKTNFDFEIVIHDDASTDGTAAIIETYSRKYPHIFKPLLQHTNQYAIGAKTMNAQFNFPRCEGKYIATCEGDDYWIDEHKLQKQVDFLEQNPQYGGVSTNNRWFFEKENTFKDSIFEEGAIRFEDLCESNKINSQTILFKKELIEDLSWMKNLKIGDWPLHLMVTNQQPYYRFPEITTVYRVHEGGVHSLLKEEQKIRSRVGVLTVVFNSMNLTKERKELLRFSIQNLLKRLIAFYPEDLKAIRKQYFSYGGSVLNKTLFKSYFK